MSTPDPDRDGVDGETPDPTEPEPRAPLDVDTTFAAIVARWSLDEDDAARPSWPAEEDVDEPWGRRRSPAGDGDDSGDSPDPVGATTDSRVIRPAVPDPFDVPPSRAEAELSERFVPPEPPPLPRGDLFSRLAWAGVLGGPLFLLIAAMVWQDAPQELVLGAVVAFIAGFVALVIRLPQNHGDDDDDGAVV